MAQAEHRDLHLLGQSGQELGDHARAAVGVEAWGKRHQHEQPQPRAALRRGRLRRRRLGLSGCRPAAADDHEADGDEDLADESRRREAGQRVRARGPDAEDGEHGGRREQHRDLVALAPLAQDVHVEGERPEPRHDHEAEEHHRTRQVGDRAIEEQVQERLDEQHEHDRHADADGHRDRAPAPPEAPGVLPLVGVSAAEQGPRQRLGRQQGRVRGA